MLQDSLRSSRDDEVIGISYDVYLEWLSLSVRRSHACVDNMFQPIQRPIRKYRGDSAGNNKANSRIKWGLRIARDSFAPRYAGCPHVEIVLVIEGITPTDGRLQS